MGKALIAWLDDKELEAVRALLPTLTTNTALGNQNNMDLDMTNCNKVHIFIIWVRTALSREFLSSCKFDENALLQQYDDGCSEGSNITHSTNVSRMKAVHQGSVILPFRADTPECIFLS